MVMTRYRPADGPLPGGTANRGRVVKVGDTVRRPSGVYSPAVHALLTHVAAAGYDGAPRVIALEEETEVLTYLDGEAALDPMPAWALTSEALLSVGELLREFHLCAATFPHDGRTWQRQIPARWRGDLITHNDTHPANIIFQDGRATGLIDFDLAAPGCPAWELAVAACFWAPLRSGEDITDSRQGETTARFRHLLDGYGADQELRRQVVEACVDANAWIAGIIEEASRRGHPAFGQLWADHADMYARAHDWLLAHEGTLATAAR
jgi:Ser/Thr protein kinase RdoA (MazF antagonist)